MKTFEELGVSADLLKAIYKGDGLRIANAGARGRYPLPFE